MARKRKSKHRFSENVEKQLCEIAYQQYTISKTNQSVDDAEFESIVDMLECRRSEKDYDWMSDVFIPEYPSIHLTEASDWANQYFQTRDYVDIYLEGDKPLDQIKAAVAKKLINTTLNTRELYHYQKYIRARAINSTRGYVIIVCNWEKKTKDELVGYRPEIDEMGIVNQVPVNQTRVLTDRFNYDVIDPRNVFMDNKYCYSIQDKEWVIIRSEMSYEDLKGKEVENGYFNLDILKEMLKKPEKTQTEKDTRGKFEDKVPPKPQIVYFDCIERFGKLWAVVTRRDEEGYPLEIDPGYSEEGIILDDAELVEGIQTTALYGGQKVLIRFQPTPFRDFNGNPYRPLIRGLCYIHPVKDIGMSDGKYSRELQVALNDTINMSNDRVKLSTFPTLKVRRYLLEEGDGIYFEPEHAIACENPKEDLEEFKFSDDIGGAIQQAALFIDKLQQINSIYPTTMGKTPELASTTATAVVGAQQQSNKRSNYKSLTFENTFLVEFYWMILQMTYQFMSPETAMKIMGRGAAVFDPNADYTYKPVSSSIELEYNKDRKVQRYDQILSRIVALAQNPAIMPLIAHIVSRQCELLGDEYRQVAPMIEKIAGSPMPPEGQGQQTATPPLIESSNQMGMPMQGMERYARGI